MNTVIGKFAKGFIFGGLASVPASLQAVGCNIHNQGDLKALGLSLAAGIVAGGLHALWFAFVPQAQ